ncbi:hypothetical protein FQR65_LT16658 [Abscondita terminalis]|nr:hypothetical protein FQR65_LT16658 [Abscondita terminalis]
MTGTCSNRRCTCIFLRTYVRWNPLSGMKHAAFPILPIQDGVDYEIPMESINGAPGSTGCRALGKDSQAGDKAKGSVMTPLEIVTTAGSMGNIIAGLATLPGAQVAGESGRLMVRGGSSSETSTYESKGRTLRKSEAYRKRMDPAVQYNTAVLPIKVCTATEEANYPMEVTPSYVADHALSVVSKYWISDLKSQLSLTGSYVSGRPYNDPNSADFMQQKTKGYSQVAMSWSYLLSQQKILFFSVTNLLGNKPVYGYNYASQSGPQGVFARQAITPVAKRIRLKTKHVLLLALRYNSMFAQSAYEKRYGYGMATLAMPVKNTEDASPVSNASTGRERTNWITGILPILYHHSILHSIAKDGGQQDESDQNSKTISDGLSRHRHKNPELAGAEKR